MGDSLTWQWQSNASGSFINLSDGGVYSNVNSATLNISNNTGLNNVNYRCIVNNSSCSVTSEPATLTVLTSPEITVQPAPAGACRGYSTMFTITATGSNLSYQWQSSPTGTTYTNLTNTGVYFGVNADTLLISSVTGLNTRRYRCIVSGSCAPIATSTSATLTVSTAPTISSQPVSVSECSGTGAFFSVTATGGTFSYQWQSDVSGAYANLSNSGVYSNVTTATMDISNVAGLDSTKFLCIVTNASCNIASDTALLTVNSTPAITSQPLAVTICSGNRADFTVAATGGSLSYQWQSSRNGTTYTNLTNTGVYSGTTTDSLGISSVTGLNGRDFRCIVSGSCTPAATSHSVILTVTTAPTITTEPASVSTCPGTSADFSITATGTTLSYQWQSNVSGAYENLSNGGIYSNVTTATLNISNVTGLNNTNYICIVSNGSCSISSTPAILTILNAPVISVQPTPATSCTGIGASFTITATGGTLTYQWQSNASGTFKNLSNGGVYSNVTTATMDISNVAGLNGLYFQCVVTGCGSTLSNSALLTVENATSITTQPAPVTACSPNNAYFYRRSFWW